MFTSQQNSCPRMFTSSQQNENVSIPQNMLHLVAVPLDDLSRRSAEKFHNHYQSNSWSDLAFIFAKDVTSHALIASLEYLPISYAHILHLVSRLSSATGLERNQLLKELKKLLLLLAAMSSKGSEASKLFSKLNKKMQASLSDDDDDDEEDSEEDSYDDEDDDVFEIVEEDDEEAEEDDDEEAEEDDDEEDDVDSFDRHFKRKNTSRGPKSDSQARHQSHHSHATKPTSLSSVIFPSRKISHENAVSAGFVEEIEKVDKYNADLARKAKKAGASVTFFTQRDRGSASKPFVASSSGIQTRFPSSSAPRQSTTAEWLARIKSSKSSAPTSTSTPSVIVSSTSHLIDSSKKAASSSSSAADQVVAPSALVEPVVVEKLG